MAFSTTPSVGNDRLRATADNQTINALAGNDWLRSTFNASTLYGGNGHDRIEVTLGLTDSSNPDAIRSATLFGGRGNDWMVSNFTYGLGVGIASRQSGGSGNDTIFISAAAEDFGRDSIDFEVYGGSGADNIWIEVGDLNAANYNFVNAGTGADIVRVFSEFTGEEGSTSNDVEAGDGDDDVIVSSSANWGSGGGGSSVSGGDGNDRLEAHANGVGGGNDLDGGNGDDALIAIGDVSDEFTSLIRNSAWGGTGNDTIELIGTAEAIEASAVHRASGGSGNDVLTSITNTRSTEEGGSTSADTRLSGGSGHDTLTASTIYGPEDDAQGGGRLYGGRGNDVLRVYGGVENILSGGTGDDTITGGSGADAMRGGAGDDSFAFLLADDATASTRDTILDFGIGTATRGRDVIDLSRVDADATTDGNQGFTFGGTGVGRVWVEENPDTAGSLIMANTGGPEILVIAVEDWASRDASDWAADDFML